MGLLFQGEPKSTSTMKTSTDNCQTPVLGLGLGVDFTFTSEQQQQEQQEPPPKFSKRDRSGQVRIGQNRSGQLRTGQCPSLLELTLFVKDKDGVCTGIYSSRIRLQEGEE